MYTINNTTHQFENHKRSKHKGPAPPAFLSTVLPTYVLAVIKTMKAISYNKNLIKKVDLSFIFSMSLK